ncbi:unnamed protein product [Urochloa humidicola]
MMAAMNEWVTEGIRASGWLMWAPLVAAYAPRGLRKMYFNLHLRRYARRLVPFLDPFVTVDIVSRSSMSGQTSIAFEEAKACSRDVLEFSAEGSGFILSLGVLMFPQQHRVLVLDEYLPHVRRHGRDLLFGKRRQSLYTNKKRGYYCGKVWSHIDFEHPATFDSLAMHPTKKRRIMEDLDSFRGNKDYYRRIGKPWKRGYLLYGPPGTGKSTMIAAMANYLNYDIYDIELTSVSSNHDLRYLLMKMKSKSIIVIEDIDCCFEDFNAQRMKNRGHIISSGVS